MGGQEVDGAGDGADGGVQRRGQVVDHQSPALGLAEPAAVDGRQQFGAQAAGQGVTAPHDVACEAQHADGAGGGAEELAVQRPERVEGGAGPAEQVLPTAHGPADEIGDDG
jgi:hypothetical protein